MRDPDQLLELDDDLLPSAATGVDAGAEGWRPVLLHALPGFVDAGSGARLAVEHLLATRPHRVVGRFDHDQLIDYRGARPTLVFDETRYTSYASPDIVVHLVTDAVGQDFLVLAGREPDFRWEAFARAVAWLVETLDVRLVLGLLAIPMTVPHTRPIGVTGHGTRAGLVPTEGNLFTGEIRVPASAASFLELRLGEAGVDAAGFAAHVPHYLSAADYPDVAIALLERVAATTGLALPTDELAAAALATRSQVSEQVEASTEVQEVVTRLERQYDAMHADRAGSLVPDDAELPSAEQLGAELERFLAGLDEGGSTKDR